jgi:hypothetical protein
MCYVRVEDLREWSKGNKKAFRFGVPVTWREPKNHNDICCSCCCDIKGYNSKNKKVIVYPNPLSALSPIVHGPEVPVPQPTEILEGVSTNSFDSGGDDEEFQCHTTRQSPKLFTQSELNDVIRDLGLPKDKAEFLGSRLKEKNLLEDVCIGIESENTSLPVDFHRMVTVYCCNIAELMHKFGVEYKVNE